MKSEFDPVPVTADRASARWPRRPALPSCACRRCLVVVRGRRVRPPLVGDVVQLVVRGAHGGSDGSDPEGGEQPGWLGQLARITATGEVCACSASSIAIPEKTFSGEANRGRCWITGSGRAAGSTISRMHCGGGECHCRRHDRSTTTSTRIRWQRRSSARAPCRPWGRCRLRRCPVGTGLRGSSDVIVECFSSG